MKKLQLKTLTTASFVLLLPMGKPAHLVATPTTSKRTVTTPKIFIAGQHVPVTLVDPYIGIDIDRAAIPVIADGPQIRLAPGKVYPIRLYDVSNTEVTGIDRSWNLNVIKVNANYPTSANGDTANTYSETVSQSLFNFTISNGRLIVIPTNMITQGTYIVSFEFHSGITNMDYQAEIIIQISNNSNTTFSTNGITTTLKSPLNSGNYISSNGPQITIQKNKEYIISFKSNNSTLNLINTPSIGNDIYFFSASASNGTGRSNSILKSNINNTCFKIDTNYSGYTITPIWDCQPGTYVLFVSITTFNNTFTTNLVIDVQ